MNGRAVSVGDDLGDVVVHAAIEAALAREDVPRPLTGHVALVLGGPLRLHVEQLLILLCLGPSLVALLGNIS